MRYSPFFVLPVLLVLASVQPGASFGQDESRSNSRKVVVKTLPIYPQVARTMKLSGTVKLEVLVQASGNVKSLQVKGGNPLLAQSAQNAIREWKWEKADHDSTERVELYFAP